MPFAITIGTFLFGLFGKKPSTDKAANLAGIAALAGLALGLIVLFFVIHDHNVIKNHDARQDAEVANAVVTADRYAGENMAARDRNFENSQAAVNSAISNAVAADPTRAKQPVGPASQSYYDELRRQKGKH